MRLGFPSRPVQQTMWLSTKSFKVTISRMSEICSFLSRLNVDLYRFPSKMFPVKNEDYTIIENGKSINVTKAILDIDQVRPEVIAIEQLGAFFKARDIRCLAHTSMYCNPISLKSDVVARSIIEIEVISYFLSKFGSGFLECRLGPMYDDYDASIERFKVFYNSLSENAKNHIVVENDFNGKMFGTANDLLNLNDKFGVPIVFDVGNYILNPREDNNFMAEHLVQFEERWKKGDLLIHYDNPINEILDLNEFWQFCTALGEFSDFDVLITSKGRELDVVRARNFIISKMG